MEEEEEEEETKVKTTPQDHRLHCSPLTCCTVGERVFSGGGGPSFASSAGELRCSAGVSKKRPLR